MSARSDSENVVQSACADPLTGHFDLEGKVCFRAPSSRQSTSTLGRQEPVVNDR